MNIQRMDAIQKRLWAQMWTAMKQKDKKEPNRVLPTKPASSTQFFDGTHHSIL